MIELQIKPNRWSCSVTALAMTLQLPVDQIIDEIGHDGSQIIYPGLPEPLCRRGFHSQELIDVAWQHDFSVTPFELFPSIRPASGDYDTLIVEFTDNWQRFISLIKSERGILEGAGFHCRHAVHFRRGEIFDPDGRQYTYTKKSCEERGFFTDRALVFKQHR
jgi:hypothetical protein